MTIPASISSSSHTVIPRMPVPEACERIVFRSDAMVLGEFRCPPSYAEFERAGRITSFVLAFPTRAVWVEREDERPFVADPGLATIYNPAQHYRRLPIAPEGDESDWIGLAEPIAREIVRHFCASDAERERPFRFARAAVPMDVLLAQRAIFRIATAPDADRLEVEERAIGVATAVLGAAYAGARPQRRDAARAHEITERAKEAIMSSLFENLSVSALSARLDVSPFHLCRTFRATAGMTLHTYRRDMRLRAALGLIPRYRGNLSALAVDVGFYSHAHFTAAFRQAFGQTPSTEMIAATMR